MLADELCDIGAKVFDELMLSTLTTGLNEDFGNAVSNLTLIPKSTFHTVVTYLCLEERRLKVLKSWDVHTALDSKTTCTAAASCSPAAMASSASGSVPAATAAHVAFWRCQARRAQAASQPRRGAVPCSTHAALGRWV